jgi:pimeloyl-ACP methyl ester carboxylesterase
MSDEYSANMARTWHFSAVVVGSPAASREKARRFGIRSLTYAAFGVGREAWELGAAMATYRTRFTAPVQPNTGRPTWTPEPVVLVHGLGHNDGAWSTLGARLGVAGFFDFTPVTYGLDDDVPRIAARIAEQVQAIVVSRSVDRVHLIGHSLGGVAIRYWHDVLGGAERADAVVTLGAPHLGTPWTRLPFLGPSARDLAIDSSVTATLGRRNTPHDHWTTIGGAFDLVVPPSRAHLPGAEAINVPAGHAGLLTSQVAAGHVCIALLNAEERWAAAQQGCERAQLGRGTLAARVSAGRRSC